MATTGAIEFTAIARTLQTTARQLGLAVPAFRSPPRSADDRVLRRHPGMTVVAVRIAGRDPHDVARDMVDGILRANDAALPNDDAVEQIRHALWAALTEQMVAA